MEADDSKINKDTPLLFSLKRKNVYTVPEGFFQDLEMDIRKNYHHRKRGLLRKMKKWGQLSVAAAIVVLALFSGIKTLLNKQYMPVETIRTIYTVLDGDRDGQ